MTDFPRLADPAPTHTPAVTVVMPVYNGLPFLRDAIACLREQGLRAAEWEILVADDGSSDGSRAFLESVQAAGGLPLRLHPGAKRGNWVASTNKMLRLAQGEWIAFLHQDDLYAPGRLRHLLALARENPSVSFFANSTTLIDARGRNLGGWTPPLSPGFNAPAQALGPLLVQNNFSVPGVFFRRDAALRAGPMDETLKYTADWDYWMRLAGADGVHYVDKPLSSFRVSRGSQTVSIASRPEEMRANLAVVVDRHAAVLGGLAKPSRARRFRRLADLSVEVNVFLGARASGLKPSLRPVWRRLLACTPADIVRYLRHSRLFPRVRARLRGLCYT